MKARTLFLLGFGALTIVALGLVALREDPVPVDLATLRAGPMDVTVDVDGKTRIAEIFEVAAPVSGFARRAPVRVGDSVVAGETVVAIVEPAASTPLDPRTRVQAEAAVREAQAGLHLARSNMRQNEEELVLAESEYRRARELVDRGVASLTRLENAEQQLEIRRAAMQAAISGLEMAMSALDRARAALIEPGDDADGGDERCCLRITAPVAGRVLGIDVLSERPVLAGTRLLSIGDPGDLEIVADVLSTDAVGMSPGDRAIVERWGGAPPLEARVSKIEPSAYTKVSALGIEEQRVDVVFDFVSPPEERRNLGDGFAVFLRVVTWARDDILQAPLSALFRQGDTWAVFVEEGGRATLRTVVIGHTNARTAEVLDGLAEGDRVVLHPSDQIVDGTPIAARAAAEGM